MSDDVEGQKDWYKPRPYPHFDSKIKLGHAERDVRHKVRSSEWVAQHAFYPLIKRVASTPRYKLDKEGNRRRRHKKRPICYAGHIDAHIFAYYSALLSELYEQRLESDGVAHCVTAYRSIGGRSNIHHAREVFAHVLDNAPCVVLTFDVKGFFDNLDHRLLKEIWRSLLPNNGVYGSNHHQLPIDHYKVFRAATKYAFVREHRLPKEFPDFYAQRRDARKGRRICSSKELAGLRSKGLIAKNPNESGIPQGLPISALLSNVYMLPFDNEVSAFSSSQGAMYRRYSDDLIVVCPVGAEKEIEPFVLSQLALRKLEVQDEKTERVRFVRNAEGTLDCQRLDHRTGKPLQYLGFTFDRHEVSIRPSSIGRYRSKMDRAVWGAAADAKKENAKEIYRRKLYRRYTAVGKRDVGRETRYGRFRGNFITYSMRAISVFEEMGLNPDGIRRQIRRHMNRIHARIKRAESSL